MRSRYSPKIGLRRNSGDDTIAPVPPDRYAKPAFTTIALACVGGGVTVAVARLAPSLA
jgi:hypothetical protein